MAYSRSIQFFALTFVFLLFTGFVARAQRDFGIDLSHYQGASGVSQSTWNQMFAEGKKFAYIKATEGLTGPDDAPMATNVIRATSAGLRAGVYHYAHPENRPTADGGVQEADHFLSYAGSAIGPGYLRPVLDLEGSASTLGTPELTDWVIAFANEIIAQRGTSAAPVIYCSQSFANNELDSRLASYDLWLRVLSSSGSTGTNNPPTNGYPSATGVFTNWALWQYSDSGSSAGITPLDLNVWHSEYKTLDSFLIAGTVTASPPTITAQPQNRIVILGDAVTFAVGVSGTPPLNYQWRLGGTNIAGATASACTRTNAMLSDAGNYSVVITNMAGSVTSSVASLVVVAPMTLFQDNFDSYATPSAVNTVGTTNGYKLLFGAASGAVDFTAIFGFDYSAVTYPKTIPPAPHASGTSKALYLTVNKDATGAAAAINLYPTNQSFTGNYSLKFDMWINWTNTATSTEHALFGINHSANITNRIGQLTSDGLFFAVDGDGNATATSLTLRDYSVFNGGGDNAVPLLLITNNTHFGPAPLLGAQFDNGNSGIASLFPSKSIPGYSTPAGSAGLEWVRAEVRQENKLVTWLLNETIIAQYTNTTVFTNGNILLGYNDNFASIGDPNNFVLFDNVRVEALNPDSDGNDLPDSWEVQYFGHLGVNPDADDDGDQVTNGREFVAGTNPTNADSFFRMLSTVQTNGSVLLQWTTVGGRSYVVQAANDLTTNFVDVSPVIFVDGTNESTTNFLHSIDTTNAAGFYRVRVVP